MGVPVIDDAVGLLTRRVSTPRDLTTVTDLGEEVGGRDEVEMVWARVGDLYRTGMHPGIQVCIRHGGEVVLDRAVGQARGVAPGRRFDPDRAVPLTVDTPVNLFSAAKAITAMVMHKLEEQGALALDDRIADHVPGFERHGKGGITIRHVLSHRAGVEAWPATAFDLDLLTNHDEVERIVCDLRPSDYPTVAPRYHAVSGGFIMESVTRRAAGRSLRDVLATEIKAPLGLGRFEFGVAHDLVDRVAENVETGLRLGPLTSAMMTRVLGRSWSEILRMSNDPRFLGAVIPSGNVIVTARDTTAFYQCIMDGGRFGHTRVFEEATIERALTPTHDDLVIDRMLGFPVRYASGFMLGSESFSPFGWDRPRAFGHVGMSNLFTWADPERELVVAILTTGKPLIGPHIPQMVQLITGINEAFPRPT
ncbi:MAG: serine hydrolase domain-containing protein [Ilumatobacteraceae bacterium]